MCFYIDDKHPNRKTANRNITCYKIVVKPRFERGDIFFAMFRPFVYKIGRLYTGRMYKDNKEIINIGFHSISTLVKAFSLSKTSVYSLNPCVIIKCIIPKGAEYYYNSIRKEYVSNQIILQEIIKQ